MANFLVSYALLSTRGIKVMLGFDHNVCPREDVVKYGDRLVEKGEISRSTLNMIKRWEAAHANAVENFPLFFGAVLFALHSGVPYGAINGLAASYTISRMAYAVAYVSIENQIYSWSRSVLWWCGNISCLTLIKMAGSRL